jgi:RNA polymerase sigma-70 factor (ECF subfamily)
MQRIRLTHHNTQRLDDQVALNAFLLDVQTGAFRIAVLATRSEAESLDLVQDSMLRWVRRYRDKPEAEWKPLFFRVLQNCIRDWQRRSILTGRIFASPSSMQNHDDDSFEDGAAIEYAGPESAAPDSKATDHQFSKALIEALRELPKRQREAFVLRTWQGLSTRETAVAMGCGEGSVMTHLSRAHKALRCQLSDWGQ